MSSSTSTSAAATAPHIVIAGAGFGGLTAARRLRKLLPGADIALVTPVDAFQYRPSLIWIPTGLRQGPELRHRITPYLTQLGVRYVRGTVTGLDATTRTRRTTAGDLHYDGLIIAPGVYVVGDAGSDPGPDWLPKQAPMADLQAHAAARNLACELQGQAPSHSLRPELGCIVDSLDQGVLVWRSPKRNFLFASRWLHHAKRLFEWYYLRELRAAEAQVQPTAA